MSKITPQRGLTLVEVLITLAIAAMIMAVLATSLAGSIRLFQKTEQKLLQEKDTPAERNFIQRLIDQRIQPDVSSPKNTQGSISEFSFYLRDHQHQLLQCEFSLIQGTGISVRLSRLSDEEILLEQTIFSEENVFQFRYFSTASGEQNFEWNPVFYPSHQLNAFGIIRAGETEPGFIFPVYAQAPIFCQFDSVIRKCRDE